MVSSGNETIVDAADFVAWFARGPGDPRHRALPRDRAPAGGVRGGAPARVRGRQGRDRHEGRHVRDGRRGGPRAHRRAGRLRPELLGDAAPLQRDPGRRLRRLDRAPRGLRPREAAARAPDRRRHQLGRRGRVLRRQGRAGRASRCRSSPRSCGRRSAPSSRTSSTSGTPPTAGRSTTTGSSSRACSSMLAESGEFDVLISAIDHSYWLRGTERHLATAIAERPARRRRGDRHLPRGHRRDDRRPADRGPRVGAPPRHPDAEGQPPGPARDRGPAQPRAVHAAAARVPADTPLEGSGALSELDSAAILAEHGVPYVRAERCASADQAAEAAERIGYPVVCKIDNVAHKARVGGVALHLDRRRLRPRARPSGWAGTSSSPSRSPRASRC